jgi:hypothetical protein
MNNAHETVLRTIIWFDIFDIAPTAMEIFEWQMKPGEVISYTEIIKSLTELIAQKKIINKNNHFCIKERGESLFKIRQQNYISSHRKQSKVKQLINYLSLFSFVKSVNFCNTRLPFLASSDSSDIDLLITASANKLWTVRFFTILPLKILRRRPGEIKKDAVDASFFFYHYNFDISKISLESPEYMAFWLLSLENVSGSMPSIKNKEFANNIFPNKSSNIRPRSKKIKEPFVKIYLPFTENLLKKIQISILPAEIKSNIDGQSIAITENYLKFHTTDRAQLYCRNFYDLCQRYKITA